MKRVVLFLLALTLVSAVPQAALACDICMNNDCYQINTNDGGYCLYEFPGGCSFQPSPGCGPDCYPWCFSGDSGDRRAGQKRATLKPLYSQWQIATVEVNGQTKTYPVPESPQRIATIVRSPQALQ
jgi:hypothetical protein